MTKKKKWQALQEAVQQNDAAQVKAVADELKLSREDGYFNACTTAVKLGHSSALRALMEAGDGYKFSSKFGEYREGTENNKLGQQLIKDAYNSPNAADILPVLYSQRRKAGGSSYYKLNDTDFLNENAPTTLLDACLKDKRSSGIFGECVRKVGLFSKEKLDFIACFAGDNKESADVLAQTLITVAGKNDIDKAKVLLKHDTDADFDDAEALRSAAKNGHQEMVNLILPHVSIKKFGDSIVTQLEILNANPSIIQSIEAAIQKAAQEPVIEATAPETAPQQQDDRFRRDEDTLYEVKKLPNESTLTTLFNFSSDQQDKFLTNENGVISTFPTVSFDDIGDKVIKTMREKFDALAEKPEPKQPDPAKIMLQVNNASGLRALK